MPLIRKLMAYLIPALSVPIVCAVSIAPPANAEEAWRVLLEEQLLRQEKCQVSYLTDLLVTGTGEDVSVRARAHCEDKRSFDAHLPSGGAKYEISACKPTYC